MHYGFSKTVDLSFEDTIKKQLIYLLKIRLTK